MVIYLEGEVDEEIRLDEMTPRQIVAELDKHVVGQRNAKRAVAIALRNRIRRQKLSPEMALDVMPKNMIMIGSTGVGKTEIARRLARMSNSPFLKVEASKFTEVGYVGRDVESMIRDLTEIAVDMVRQEKIDEVAEKAELNVEEQLLTFCCHRRARPKVSMNLMPLPATNDHRARTQKTLLLTNSFSEHEKNFAHNCAKANWTTGLWKWRYARRIFRSLSSPAHKVSRRWAST